FIGGHLARRLCAEGHEVTALVRTPSKADALVALGVTLLHGDLSLFARPDCVLPPADVVIHLAGVVTASDPAQYEAINFTAVVDLMDCLERQDWMPRRLLFASSLAAAGPSPADHPWTEADPLSPIDPYGEAKARAEGALAAASFPVTCFRPPVVLGPGDPAFLTIFKAAKGRVGIRVAGEPQRLSWVYIDDLIAAILAMAEDTGTENATYFTTSEETVDIRRLWSALSAALDRRILVLPIPGPILAGVSAVAVALSGIFGFTNQLDDKQVAQMRASAFVCTSARLTADLGWRAQVGFEDAVTRTARGYTEMGWL
ncbi:MAG: nucleoside-diphosphate-sugar epimerase, partial [Myxococcota bacterium]